MNALKGIFYVVMFQFGALGMFGNWGWLGLPILVVVGAGTGLYRAYKLEVLRREMVTAQQEADRAAEAARLAAADLALAKKEYKAACKEQKRLKKLLREQGWLVADKNVSLN